MPAENEPPQVTPKSVAAETAAIAPAVAEYAVRTPLVEFASLGSPDGSTVLVKCEHQQRTGSFKLRGALAALLSTTPEVRARGVVTASTGNHGLGVAQALADLGGRGIICVPPDASAAKLAALRRYDVELRTLGTDSGDTERRARQLAAELGMPYISPYNDPHVVAGQGTIALEILDQLGDRDVDAIVVAVGGGGLISGIAATVRTRRPRIRVVGASPANDAAMAASVSAGRIVDVAARPTLSDGTAGGIDPDAITFDLCRDLVDDWLLVAEDDIRDALRRAVGTEGHRVEGAAGVALAAARRVARSRPGSTVVAVSCGANITDDTLRAALGNGSAGRG